MKKSSLILIILLAAALPLFAAGQGDSYKYAIGICHFTPRTDADRAVIRAILATLEENRVEAMIYDTGDEGEGMLTRVDLLLKDRGVYGIIIICDDPATAVEVTAKCAKARVPVAILGEGPEDLETFPAIVVVHDERRGYEKLMEGTVSLCGQKTGPLQPVIMAFDPDSPWMRWLIDRFNTARTRTGGAWKEPLILKTGAVRAETRTIVTDFLKKNRSVNPIVIPGRDVEALMIPLIGLGRWLNSDDPLHTVIGCMDGSAAAVEYLEQGYIDLIGGRDVATEAESLVNPLIDNIKSRKGQVSLRIPVPGRIITRGDLSEKEKIAWNENNPLVPAYQTEREARKAKKKPDGE